MRMTSTSAANATSGVEIAQSAGPPEVTWGSVPLSLSASARPLYTSHVDSLRDSRVPLYMHLDQTTLRPSPNIKVTPPIAPPSARSALVLLGSVGCIATTSDCPPGRKPSF